MKSIALSSDRAYPELLRELAAEILTERSSTSIVSEALAVDSGNPFWRIRAEYFDQLPKLLAEAFAPPDAARVGLLEEMMPSFLEGSRGTGKTMLLLSLRGRILAARTSATRSPRQLFGFYVRLERGAFCNAGLDPRRGEDPGRSIRVQIEETFGQEFYLTLIESLVSELEACKGVGGVEINQSVERLLAAEIGEIIAEEFADSDRFSQLLLSLGKLRRRLAEFVRRRFIYDERVSVPLASLDINSFKAILATTRRLVPTLVNAQFTVLLDEYENLLTFQKRVVNALVKLGPPDTSIKIARKIGTEQTSATPVGQDLQEIHDYNRLPLVYSVDDHEELARYYSLVERMVSNLLQSSGQESILDEILPEATEAEADEDDILKEILKLHKLSLDDFNNMDPSAQRDRHTYYREAAIYRLVLGRRGARNQKVYAGARQVVFLSSGIIRYFQEILGLAYYLEYGKGTAPEVPRISAVNQTRAVHVVSKHNLEALSRNVAEYGEALKYLLLDLGDCLREKLLHHPSEPEGGRLAIRNPEVLSSSGFHELENIIRIGVREGVLQEISGRPGMRPKHSTEPQPVEFNIARIYAPALEFSPRLRWTSLVTCGELRGLLDANQR